MIPKGYIMLLIAAVSFTSGWTVKKWQSDSVSLAIEKAAAATADKWKANESELAELVSTKLKGLRANETIIEREIPKIINRPVYNVRCLDADGLRAINGDIMEPIRSDTNIPMP